MLQGDQGNQLSDKDLLLMYGYQEHQIIQLEDGSAELDLTKIMRDWSNSSMRNLLIEEQMEPQNPQIHSD